MKKIKKFIIPALLVVFIGGFVSFYYFDPLEPFHNYKLPSGDSDFILCYYQADLGAKDKTYYIINADGSIKKIVSEYPLNYVKLAERNGQGINWVKDTIINSDIIGKIKKINPNNCRRVSHVEESEVAFPESCYYVVNMRDDDVVMRPIKVVYYNGSLGNSPKLVSICRSRYTDDICDFIDEKVTHYENSIS